MVLAGAVSASGCALSARPEAPGGAAASPGAGWWSACHGLRLPPIAATAAAWRPDVEAAQARLAQARRAEATGPRGLGLSGLLSLTSRGLTYLVRSGADTGQAGLGYRDAGPGPADPPPSGDARAAAARYRRVLDEACGEVRGAAAAAGELELRTAQARASLADAEAASAGLRRRIAEGQVPAAELELALGERAVRRDRLAAIEAERAAAERALAEALGQAP